MLFFVVCDILCCMNPEIPLRLLILKEACRRLGYEWKLLDTYSNALAEISSETKSFFTAGDYPINSNTASHLARDKAWSYLVLQKKGYRVPKGEYFFLREDYRSLRGDGKEWNDAFLYAHGKYPLFVKPNAAAHGLLAESVADKQELETHLKKIAQISPIALIQEPISFPEYRIFAVDGRVHFLYRRSAPALMGDGKKTIAELLEDWNHLIKDEKSVVQKDSSFLLSSLTKDNLSFESILPLGAKLRLTSKANISAGGIIEDYQENVSPEVSEWVRCLMKDCSLRVCGIDVFVDGDIDDPKNFIICEINQGPGLSGICSIGKEEKAVQIWEEILRKYFEE